MRLTYHIDTPPVETLRHMAAAHVLVTDNSGFSGFAGTLSRGIVLVSSSRNVGAVGWVPQPARHGFLNIKSNGIWDIGHDSVVAGTTGMPRLVRGSGLAALAQGGGDVQILLASGNSEKHNMEEYPVLIIDEANLAFSPKVSQNKPMLDKLVHMTKQERKMMTLLTSLEHGYPYFTSSIACSMPCCSVCCRQLSVHWRRTQRGLAVSLSSGMPGDNDTALQGTWVQPVRVITLAYARDYGPKRRAAGAFHWYSDRRAENLDRAK